MAEPFGDCKPAGEEPNGGGFHVALAAGDLTGKAQARLGVEPQGAIEELRRVEEGVAVKAAEAREFGPLEARNGAEEAGLLAVLELGLEADDVEQGAEPIVLAQLNDSIGLDPRRVWIGEAERLHRPMAQGFAAARRHHLDGQAAVEIGRLPVVEGNRVAGEEGGDEGVVLLARERTVDVIGARSTRSRLVVARLQPSARHVDRFAVNDRGDGVEEGERVLAGELGDRFGKRRRGQGSGGDDDAVPIGRRQACDLLAADVDQRMGGKRRGHGRREALAIDRQCASCRDLIDVGRAHDQRAEAAHFLMQEADGVVFLVVGAEGVRADELRERGGLVGRGRAQRTHLVEHDRDAARGDLPSRLGSGKPAADDVHCAQTVFGHGARLSRPVLGVANRGWRNEEPVGVKTRARLLRLKAKAPARCGRLWR